MIQQYILIGFANNICLLDTNGINRSSTDCFMIKLLILEAIIVKQLPT